MKRIINLIITILLSISLINYNTLYIYAEEENQEDIIEEETINDEEFNDTESLTVSVSYTELVCASPVTFKFNASGGSGNYKYMLQCVYGYVDGVISYVSDPSYSAYQENNTFTFTFYASGTYKVYCHVMDMSDYSIHREILTLTISDSNYPSIESIADSIVEKCNQICSTDYQKALYLHDWLLEHCTYDYSYTYAGAEGALVRGTGTCEAYHRAYVMLLNRAGFETRRIEGNFHVWTGVKIDGNWYQVDCTWDSSSANTYGFEKYLYFGVDDYVIESTHTGPFKLYDNSDRNTDLGYDASLFTSLSQNYFIQTNTITNWIPDSDSIESTIQSAIKQGSTSFTIPVSCTYAQKYIDAMYHIYAYYLSNYDFDENATVDVTYDDNQLTGTITYHQLEGKSSITFNANGGTGQMNRLEVDSASSVTLPINTFIKTGYVFDGWIDQNGNSYTDGQTITIDSDLILYASWKTNINQFIVEYNGNGATSGAMENQSFLLGESANLTKNAFVKTGYVFKGWSTTENGEVEYSNGERIDSMDNELTTLYAVWEQANEGTYSIYFDVNETNYVWTWNTSPRVQIYNENRESKIISNCFQVTGKSFVCWNTKADGSGINYYPGESIYNLLNANETMNLYAQWKSSSYCVSYYGNGGYLDGQSYLEDIYTEDTTISIRSNPFTRLGYTFLGWSTSNNGSAEYSPDDTITVTSSGLTLYAVWTQTSYTIAFDGNGGSGSISSIPAVYGYCSILPTSGFTRTGYVLSGWNTKADGSGTNYCLGCCVSYLSEKNGSTVTLYAQWQQAPMYSFLKGYSITLDGTIGFNFYMELDESIQNESTKMIFNVNSNQIEVPFDATKKEVVNGNTYYLFTCPISAKDMTTPVRAYLSYNGGNSGIYTYSLEDYAKDALDLYSDQETMDVIYAMMTYGYHVQKYFGYNIESLPSICSQLSSFYDLDQYAYKCIDNDLSISFVGARLVLTSRPGLKLYFKGSGTFFVDGKEVEATTEGNYTVITIENITDIYHPYLISCGDLSLEYSIASYANVALNGSNEILKNLVKSMIDYYNLFNNESS